MKKNIYTTGIFLGTLFSTINAELITKGDNPGSAWNDEVTNMLIDRVARKEGDLITILINESSTATYAANTTVSKKDSNVLTSLLNLGPLTKLNKILGLGNNSVTSQNAGDGTSVQNHAITAKMTAVVREALPNGRLLIEGSQRQVINKETRIVALSGVIRVEDIDSSTNSIRSDQMAESEIRIEGKGLIQDRQRRGLVTRILDWLF